MNPSVKLACAAVAGLCALFPAPMFAAERRPDAADRAAQARQARVDGLFAAFDRPGSPGVALGIYQGGQTQYARGYGYANLEHQVPVTPRTVFQIASISKQFTAFAAALLAREGKLRLDADVRTYLPYVPDFGEVITVNDLIRHTSGLRDDLDSLAGRRHGHDGNDLIDQRHQLNLLKQQRGLNFAPSTDALYCNMGYQLLAEIVAAVSGMSYREFVTERIFRPLGMTQTLIQDRYGEVVAGRAESYTREASGGWRRMPLDYGVYGSTGQLTTIEDMAKWIRNLRRPVVGDTALVAQMSQPGTLRDGRPVPYGLGVWRWKFAGHEAIMHTGSSAAFRALFAWFPGQDFAIVIFCNTPLNRFNLVEAIADVYLNDGDGSSTQMPPAVDPAATLLQATAGHYMNPLGRMITLEMTSDRLSWTSADGAKDAVVFRNDGSMDTGGERYWGYWRPVRGAHGAVTGLEETIDFLGRKPVQYVRIEQTQPDEASLRGLAGDYRCAELDVSYRVSVEQGRLVARSLWTVEPVVLVPTLADRFDSSLGALQFRRDADGRAVEFLLNGDNAHHVRFERMTQR